MITGPIPGESLTKPPKNYNWERPPEISDPEEAIIVHLERLQDEDRMNIILDALEFEALDLKTLVQGMMRSAVANGVHNIDVGLIAAPIVHEYIKQTAEALDIEFDEGLGVEEEREKSQMNRTALMAQKKLKKLKMEPTEFTRDEVVEEDASEIAKEVAPSNAKGQGKGLGARPMKEEM
jgi:hypothetical protein